MKTRGPPSSLLRTPRGDRRRGHERPDGGRRSVPPPPPSQPSNQCPVSTFSSEHAVCGVPRREAAPGRVVLRSVFFCCYVFLPAALSWSEEAGAALVEDAAAAAAAVAGGWGLLRGGSGGAEELGVVLRAGGLGAVQSLWVGGLAALCAVAGGAASDLCLVGGSGG